MTTFVLSFAVFVTVVLVVQRSIDFYEYGGDDEMQDRWSVIVDFWFSLFKLLIDLYIAWIFIDTFFFYKTMREFS